HTGKIDSEFGSDSSRDRRRSHTRFFSLWWQPCRLRRRHACLYSFLFLFLLRLAFLLGLLFRLFFFGLFFLLFRFLRPLFFFFFFWLFSRSLFALAANECDFVANVYFAAFFNIDFGECSIFRRFPFHCRLISLNFSEDVASRNLVAFLFLPSDESSLRHRVAQFGHLNLRHRKK